MAASHYNLDNLTAILDNNRIQATGPIAERFDTNPYNEKWKANGWHVLEIDGHDVQEIENALSKAEKVKNKPTMIIAHTVKGKGVPFAENSAIFHHGIMNQDQFLDALKAVKL